MCALYAGCAMYSEAFVTQDTCTVTGKLYTQQGKELGVLLTKVG